MPQFAEIDIEKITLGEPNVRKTDADLGIDELARSIEQQGLLQPIIVRKLGNEFELFFKIFEMAKERKEAKKE